MSELVKLAERCEAAVEEAEHHFAGSQAARAIRALDPAQIVGGADD